MVRSNWVMVGLSMLVPALVAGPAAAETAAGKWIHLHGKGKLGYGYEAQNVFVPSGTWKDGSRVPDVQPGTAKRECSIENQPKRPDQGQLGVWRPSPFADYPGWVYLASCDSKSYPVCMTPPPRPATPPAAKDAGKCQMDDPAPPPPPKVCVKWKDKKKKHCAKWK